MLTPPSYIPISQIKNEKIEYEWDTWDPAEMLGEPNDETLEIMSSVSDRGNIAYSIGCAEWVTFRLIDHIKNDIRPLNYLEACWVFEMSGDIFLPKETKESEWQGIILAPIDMSLITIINTSYFSEDGQAELKSSFSELVPLHVIKNKNVFIEWRDLILKRLRHYYPKNDNDPWGSPVPREILDPNCKFDPKKLDDYVGNFMGNVDNSNPYLEYRSI